jgi:hypothetical protein
MMKDWSLGKKLTVFGIIVFALIIVAASMRACPREAQAQTSMDVTLAWDHNAIEQVQYFIVCYGTTSGTYQNEVSTSGPVLDYTVAGLPYGEMTYFAVKAFGWNGRESGYSNEVCTDGVTIPPEAPAAPGCWIQSIEVY